MAIAKRAAEYDALAWFYDRTWGDRTSSQIGDRLDVLDLVGLPSGARVLDLCCGTGQLARALAARGFDVTGLDVSPDMIAHARSRAPEVTFVVADARSFAFDAPFDAVVSTFNSLNHAMSVADLEAVFACVHRALRPGGRFTFDMTFEEGFVARWDGSFAIVEDAYACIVRPTFLPAERLGRNLVTRFRRNGGGGADGTAPATWQRVDLVYDQRCFERAQIEGALAATGFGEVRARDAAVDLELSDERGRVFFSCRTAPS